MKEFVRKVALLVLTAVSLVSGCQCSKDDPKKTGYDKVMILYSAGFNSLSSYLAEDIEDLQKGYIPSKDSRDAILIVSHQPGARRNYSTATSPCLIRLYKDKKAGTVMDTLKVYEAGTVIAEASVMKSILTKIKDEFKADHYGMVFSSHASGWLPAGYYNYPELYDLQPGRDGTLKAPRRDISAPSGAVPYREPEEIPGAPAVKSLGMSNTSNYNGSFAYEIDLPDFASALPMHFDYIILDACLSGGIEVAYEFKDVCDLVCFSQAEVLAEGLDYKNLSSRLLEKNGDVVGVASDYFSYYASQSSESDRSATISVVDCTALEPLTELCRTLFSNYRSQIAALDPDTVQRYYRTSHHWFYDLEDILLKAGISAPEQKELSGALSKCVTYKAATDAFLENYGGFRIETFSGFSMYLPCNGSSYLDNFYKTLAWNKATGLVN